MRRDERTGTRLAAATALAIGLWLLWPLWSGWQPRAAGEAARQAEQLAALETKLVRTLESARDGAFLPGVSAAFALPDGRVGTAAVGLADIGAELPMTSDTRFLAGSVGKSFHAALALALHRDGAIDLDAPIARWLGDAPWFDRLPNGPELTLRWLLQHRSGLIDHVFSAEFWAKTLLERLSGDADALLSPEELIEIALDRDPRFRAGQGFAYGDTNYVLAGLVIERATGRSPFDQIETRFLEPLELDTITPARTRRIPDLAAGYQMPLNLFLLPPKSLEGGALHFHPMIESTAGGLAATPRDLVRWAKALFEGRALPGPYLDELVGRSVATGDGRRYGLGVYLYTTPLGPAWGHGGFFPGYKSKLLYFPDARVAVCVQVNRDFLTDLDALVIEVARQVIREVTPSL